MPSVTSWTRLEPQPRDPAMPGFAARVGDPLWLLGRQWQLGELTGEDAGSPVAVDLTVEIARLSRYRPALPDGTPGTPLDPAVPLEPLVEAEAPAPVAQRGDDRTAAVAGARFLARLGPLAGTLRGPLVAAYPLAGPSVLRTRVPDGRLLYAALAAARAAGNVGAAVPGLAPADAPVATAAALAWLTWYEARQVPAGQAPPAWRPARLGYEFAVAAPGASGGEQVLVAADHDGGRVDWWSLDLHRGASLGAATDPAPVQISTSVLPAGPVLRGLPADRFWEFEPGDVNLDAVSAAPEDLGRLLFTEFAVAYGNDFFMVPVEVPVASVVRVRGLTVRTTFGETVAVPTAEAADTAAGRAPFRLFQHTVAAGGSPGEAAPLLVVLPTVAGALAGEPVEEVLFARDEMANLAWAIERRVPGVDGRPVERAEQLRRPPLEPVHSGLTPRPPQARYRLATPVPANWLPLVPRATDAAGAPRPVLRRTGPAPVGRLLADSTELHAECLSRYGYTVDRRVQRVRCSDGRTVLWMARQRTAGRGESSVGLRFDGLVGD